MPSFLWKLLACILALGALVAAPTALQVHRSIRCTGQVTEVRHSEREQRDNDGTLNLIFTDTHLITFKNPQTGAEANGALDDINKSPGATVSLLYDPKDKSIVLDNPWTLYHTPLWITGTLLAFFLIVVVVVRSR